LVGKLSGRRWYAILMVALPMVAMLLVMVLPEVADAKKHKAEYANGTGVVNGVAFTFNVKANDKNASTDSVTGTFKLSRGTEVLASGPLSCLRTGRAPDGSRIANFTGKITDGSLFVTQYISFDTTDHPLQVDSLNYSFSATAFDCHPPTGSNSLIDDGKIDIHPLK
jgi:hypothetical protein